MNENINLCEILKDCPKGEKFYSPLLGNVTFAYISWDFDKVMVNRCNSEEDEAEYDIESDGHIYIGSVKSVDIMLYPSKDQLDWSKWECPKPNKPKFDPKTLKAFDRVLVRFDCGAWSATLFSHLIDSKFANKKYDIICCGSVFGYCIPYNDDTKHLVGTKDEAPEFYKYWED